ncbi:MAG TPA: hypothetical protein VJC37_03610, partial [Planctomycetota bacterium]|nr:hypothetical protein [Planctomycetota bacterium]
GYAKGGMPDTSVTVWQIQVLRLASTLDMEGVPEALRKSRQWLNEMTNDDGLVGFQARMDYPNGPDAQTAAGLNAWLMIQSVPGMGNDAIAQRMDGLKGKQSAHLRDRAGRKSNTGEETDLYYWYWAGPTILSAEDWDRFNAALKDAILKGQSKKGSWNNDDQWSVYGGEIYTTSMAVLTLQIYYRNPALRVD